MLSDALRGAVEGASLDEAAARRVMERIMAGGESPALIAAYLVALRMKGETVAELTGFARAMRDAAVRVDPTRRPLLDTCGTGGDASGSVNISTIAAFVAAAAGVRVAKHGNRSNTSSCGSADLMEALGVPLELEAESVAACIDAVGIGFMFAPRFHPAMRHVGPLRRELGFRTVFNLLGPLANPARVEHHVMGVFAERWLDPMAEVLAALGVQSALVVHGHGGLDEIALSGPTRAVLLRDGERTTLEVEPTALGLRPAPREALAGGMPADNARRARAVLAGEPGPVRDAVLLNAAGGLLAAGRAEDLREGLALAAKAVDSGGARERLEALVAYC